MKNLLTKTLFISLLLPVGEVMLAEKKERSESFEVVRPRYEEEVRKYLDPTKNEDVNILLRLAVANNNPDEVEQLLKNVNKRFVLDGEVLALAIDDDRSRIVELFLENKVFEINETIRGSTPLILASKKGNIEIVELFLKDKANVNTGSGYSALMYAAKHGYLEIVKMLLKNEANVNFSGSVCLREDTDSPIVFAVRGGHLEIVETLLKNKANVNPGYGDTPLVCAAESNNLEIVKLLLTSDEICLSKKGKSGNTAMEAAANHGNSVMVALLAKKRKEQKESGGGGIIEWLCSSYKKRVEQKKGGIINRKSSSGSRKNDKISETKESAK